MILTGCLLLQGVTATGFPSARESTTAPQNKAPEKQQPPRDTTRRYARLVLEEHSHNFGDIPRKGGDLVREFAFRNEGTTPLVLLQVQTSCHCLRAQFPKRPVAPGGQGTIRIIYEPNKSEAGAFHKVIQIYSNSDKGREIITVQGNSIDARNRRSAHSDAVTGKTREKKEKR